MARCHALCNVKQSFSCSIANWPNSALSSKKKTMERGVGGQTEAAVHIHNVSIKPATFVIALKRCVFKWLSNNYVILLVHT